MGREYNTARIVTSQTLFSRPRLEINLAYLSAVNRAYGHSDPEELQSFRETLQEAFAEEMYHYYHSLRYPKTWERTGLANRIGGDAYRNDRGESLAKAFAKRYVSFKKGTLN